MPVTDYIRWFRELSLTDLPLVGGKNASLGEMFQQLTPLGVRVPDGFAVTAPANKDALDAADAWPELHRLLDKLDKTDVTALAKVGRPRAGNCVRRAHAQGGGAAVARSLAHVEGGQW